MLIWHPLCVGSLNGVLREEVEIDMWEFVISRAEHGFTSMLGESPLRAVTMQKLSGVILSSIEYRKGLSSKER